MEIITAPVYFDTNVFIYTIDGYEEYQELLSSLLYSIANKNILVVTSELTLAECLVKPIKDENQEAIEQFKKHIQNSDALKVKSVSREILVHSATIRNQLGLKLPDAIHMATAINQKCKTFVTNDKKLRVPEGMQRLYLKELLNKGELIE